MDSNSARRAGKQPYEAVRDQLDQLGEKVIGRHWDPGAPVPQGYRRFLGALDGLAGRLLDDDEIAQRGQDLLRETQPDGTAEADGATETGEAGDSLWTQASDDAEAAGDQAAEEVRKTEEARRAEEALRADEAQVGESWAAGNARVAEAQSTGATGAGAAAAEAAQTVDVVFSLPAETQAERVALCGDFNDWAPEGISLARGNDRTWRVTVPLTPGIYRYKFLLDGETWENGTDADRYEENAYGTQDSVIEVR